MNTTRIGHRSFPLIRLFLIMLSLFAVSYPLSARPSGNPLPIPPLLEDNDPSPERESFNLVAQNGAREFFPGSRSATKGYNGSYLGPVLRVWRGHNVTVNIENRLNEKTTVHWHGLEVDGAMDGGPFYPHASGERWTVRFTVDQPAATLWYHPHVHGLIGEQVYRGLSGILIVEDDITENLPLPKDYGINDIPLILQDKRFDSGGNLLYKTSVADLMHGMFGNTMVVNGAVNPYLDVGARKIRFRLINGSNARTFELSLSDGSSFKQIATDGGLLEQPFETRRLVLSPGERAEIIADFSGYKEGSTLSLVTPGLEVLRLHVTGTAKDDTRIPKKMVSIAPIQESSAEKKRTFVLEQMGPNVTINGKRFSMNRIDEKVRFGATEIWEIRNAGMGGMMGPGRNFMSRFRGMIMMRGGMAHPFHIHGIRFQVLERNGQKPSPAEQGWKDTVLLYPGDNVRVIAKFMRKGAFVYHCHILEHDDLGMMGSFVVE